MNTLGVIPARYNSSRFPGKPLVDLGGVSMIMRVYAQCKKAELLDEVIVATDDERIFRHVVDHGGKVCMTKAVHRSGTERVSEVAELEPDYDFYVNIQGDEPFIEPQQINQLVKCLFLNDVKIATLIKLFQKNEDLFNPNLVKVVTDQQGKALYFSRSVIPYLREVEDQSTWIQHHRFFQHIGIYGFERATLMQIPEMEAVPLEKTESLEQLRWLGNGIAIQTALSDYESIAIDTPEDFQKVRNMMGW